MSDHYLDEPYYGNSVICVYNWFTNYSIYWGDRYIELRTQLDNELRSLEIL